jgi:hypothetical protein
MQISKPKKTKITYSQILQPYTGTQVSKTILLCSLHVSSGVFPDELKDAKITPIFKSGVRSEVNNYTGLFLFYL